MSSGSLISSQSVTILSTRIDRSYITQMAILSNGYID